MLEGRVGMKVGRERLELGAGDGITVLPGTAHKFWNAGGAKLGICAILWHVVTCSICGPIAGQLRGTAVAMRPATRCTRVEFFGLPLDLVTLDDMLRAVDEVIETRGQAEHGSLAANNVVRANDHPEYLAALRRHCFVTADGQGVVWAARLLGHAVPERVTGADLMLALLGQAEARGHRVYLLGAAADVLADAEAAIKRRHPRLAVVGRHHGYFAPADDDRIVEDIAASQADLLFLAFPSPRKEIFLMSHRDALRVPFAMGVGGMFDVIAGRVRRAPGWIQKAGLEWAFRMVQEPRRLFVRYVTTHTKFVARVAGPVVRHKLGRDRLPIGS